MIAHPIGFILFLCAAFWIAGLDSKDRKKARRNHDRLFGGNWAGLTTVAKIIIYKIGIYNIALSLTTASALVVCWLSTPETKLVVIRRYVLIMFVVLVIKRLSDFVIVRKADKFKRLQ